MNKEQVNKLLKSKIGFSSNNDIEEYRNTFLEIVKDSIYVEEDFYHSIMSWWNDGNAPYYDSWLRENWS